MKITCNTCKNVIPATDINIKDKIAKCESCNSVFDCRDQLSAVLKKDRQELGLPKHIEVEKKYSHLSIIRGWFNPAIIFLTIFCVFWDGFMIVWFGIAISQGQWPMALFGSIHGLVGVGLTYYTIAGYINKTYISVDSRAMTIEHAPLPFGKNKYIRSKDLKQLYSKEKVHHGKNGASFSYEVHAVTATGSKIKIVSGLSNSDQALYIEQEIEKFLKIEDMPVRGEIPREVGYAGV